MTTTPTVAGSSSARTDRQSPWKKRSVDWPTDSSKRGWSGRRDTMANAMTYQVSVERREKYSWKLGDPGDVRDGREAVSDPVRADRLVAKVAVRATGRAFFLDVNDLPARTHVPIPAGNAAAREGPESEKPHETHGNTRQAHCNRRTGMAKRFQRDGRRNISHFNDGFEGALTRCVSSAALMDF